MPGPAVDENVLSGAAATRPGQFTDPEHDGTASEPTKLWLRPAKIGLATAIGTAAIAAINPTDSGFVICWSKHLGIDCPFCGGLRTVSSLAHGDFMAALDHNLLLALALPALTVIWVLWMVTALRGRQFTLPKAPRWLIACAAIIVVAFTIARNLDGPTWITYLASGTYRG